MDVRPALKWTDADRLDMAYLIVEPRSNGGYDAGLSASEVAAQLPTEAPAWGVWVNGDPVFLVGLMPFNGQRGCLHVAGTGTLSHAEHVMVVRAFLNALPGVSVFTVTHRPALARLARSVGFRQVGEQDGQMILERAMR